MRLVRMATETEADKIIAIDIKYAIDSLKRI